MERIKQDIKTGEFGRLYLLYGDDEYFRNFYKTKLKEALISEDDAMNLTEFTGKDVDVNTIMDTARTIPFLSERRVVIVSSSELLNPKSKKEIEESEDDGSENPSQPESSSKAKKEKEYGLADFLSEIPETTVLIFNEENVKKTCKLYKACEKYGHVSCFEKIKENDATGMKKLEGYVLQKLKIENKNITYGAMRLFLERTGTDLHKVFIELDKLICYTLNRDSITEDDVKALTAERLEDKIFEMIECVSARQQVRALDLYYDLLKKKESPVKILSLIERHYHQLYVVKSLSQTGMAWQDILKQASIIQKEFLYKKYMNLTRQYSLEDLKNAMEMCLDFDKAFKSGKMKDNVAVEMVIVAMSSRKRT